MDKKPKKQKKDKHPDDLRPDKEQITPPGVNENEWGTNEIDYDPEEYDDFNTFYETNE